LAETPNGQATRQVRRPLLSQLALLISDKVLVKPRRCLCLGRHHRTCAGRHRRPKGATSSRPIKLTEAGNVEVDESELTGESVAVRKAVQVDGTTGGDTSLLFTGSTTESGELTGVVYAIGNGSALGEISAPSASIHKVTQYQKSLKSLSTLLMKIVVASLAVTVLTKIALGHGAPSHAAKKPMPATAGAWPPG
jgi:hypothetical protein